VPLALEDFMVDHCSTHMVGRVRNWLARHPLSCPLYADQCQLAELGGTIVRRSNRPMRSATESSRVRAWERPCSTSCTSGIEILSRLYGLRMQIRSCKVERLYEQISDSGRWSLVAVRTIGCADQRRAPGAATKHGNLCHQAAKESLRKITQL
jgi:hypothetical protein